MTIRTRLALWYSGLLTLLIVIFGIAVITVSRVTLLQAVDDLLINAANNIDLNVDVLASPDAIDVTYHSEDFFHTPGMSVQVWHTFHNNELLDEPILKDASNDIGAMTLALDPNFLPTTERAINSIVVNHLPQRVITEPLFTISGEHVGVIQVGTPLNSVANANDQLLLITLVSAIICILVSIALSIGLSRHMLKPIDAVTKAAGSIVNAKDLSTRLEWSGPEDELGKLTKVFNRMMERLEELFAVQQRFIGDVSHELRTPLTSIIGHVEIMERYGVDEESLDAVNREAGRMSRMVNDLLLLTRADFGDMTVDLYPLDLDVLVLDVYEQAVGLAKKRDLKILIERIEPVQIHGNTDRLRQLMLNLIGNAIKFTEDGGTVALSAYPQDENAIIDVRDTGIGISEENLNRIFDRFFQADFSRVHRDDADGAGLGLSIARWIVDSHGGDIHVHSDVGKGTLFRISIPIDGKRQTQEIKHLMDAKLPVQIKSRHEGN